MTQQPKMGCRGTCPTGLVVGLAAGFRPGKPPCRSKDLPAAPRRHVDALRVDVGAELEEPGT